MEYFLFAHTIHLITMSYYRRQISPDREFKDSQEYSTAEKYYDVEESQRRYEDLIQENLWLKDQI